MAKKRKALSKRVRFEVFKRDSFTCVYCGRTPPAVMLQIDHVVPVADGGTNDIDNLVTSCEDCNQGKGARSLSEAPKPFSEGLVRKREMLAQLEEYNTLLAKQRGQLEDDADAIGQFWWRKMDPKTTDIFGPQRASSIKTFLKHLPREEILESVDIAYSRYPFRSLNDNTTWKYFCGICWRKIKGE